MAYNIGVLGDKESIIGYMSIGLKTYSCAGKEEALCGLKTLASECAIIYVVEDTAQNILEEIAEYNKAKLPAVILIPGSKGSLGIGKRLLRESVEKAVGSNVLDNN